MQNTEKKSKRTTITTKITVEVVNDKILWGGRDINGEMMKNDPDAWADVLTQITQNAVPQRKIKLVRGLPLTITEGGDIYVFGNNITAEMLHYEPSMCVELSQQALAIFGLPENEETTTGTW